ncbi:gasdermin Eb [Megalops cyprinoides]|uniref:gasdermin Eb n=1 Tax=Megalops cyprinoides TaxID=118141 RepID=UPI0018647127|nr:gasdermin Eb [Megalops cyprinoides]
MFAKATSNFVKQIDPDGCLIPVSRLNDSDKLVPLSLVVKRKRFWFWQRHKYLPSDFTLSDVLLGSKPINPVVVETDFLKYAGTFGDTVSGKVDAELGKTNVSVEGKGSFKLQSSFGSLRKQEVDVQKLLQDSKDRVLNLEHCLIQQTREKRNEVFGILKERIVTTQQCSVTEEVQEQGDCGGVLGFLSNRRITVSVNENGNMQQDSNISLEIPPQTVIAYSLIELVVKHSGQYELCLQPDTHGGFEVDSSIRTFTEVDGHVGQHSEEAPVISAETLSLKKELDSLQAHFQQLKDLPAPTRSTLLQLLKTVMMDREAVSALESGLVQLCHNETADLSELEESPSLKQKAQTLLDLVLQSSRADQSRTDGASADPHPSSQLLYAAHVLVSAMAEMNDAALTALTHCCSPQFLQALQQLVHCLAAEEELNLQDPALSPLLEEEGYKRAQQLFYGSGVILRKEAGTLRVEMGDQPGLLPFVMSVTIQGLASLGKPDVLSVCVEGESALE